jgi:hypothetical protein
MRFNLDNYETVEARLAKFWEMYPNGQVFTAIHHYDDNKVVFRAEIYKEITDPRPVATGYAEEIRDASPVNRTSHVENAETSAIGRALANFVFQSKTAPRPSREEMSKVARSQEFKADAELLSKFRAACTKAGLDPQDVALSAGVDLYDLTDAAMPKLRDAFRKMQQSKTPSAAAPAPVGDNLLDKVKEVFPSAEVTEEPKIKDPTAPATNSQIGKLRAMLMANGIGERPKQVEAVADIINRPIAKLDMLNKGEANQAIKVLEARATRG